METLGERLKRVRARAGMSQKRLAAASEVHRQTISDIECDRDPNPRRITLLRLARAMGVDVSELEATDEQE